jgi:CspA family cold shock protein
LTPGGWDRRRYEAKSHERHREVLQHCQGFSFIEPDDGDKEIFVHATALEAAGIRSLTEGDRASFEPEDDLKGRGKQAGQLKRI